MKHEFDRIHTRLDRIDNQLTSLIQRESSNTESIRWIKGYINTVTALITAAIGYILTKLWR